MTAVAAAARIVVSSQIVASYSSNGPLGIGEIDVSGHLRNYETMCLYDFGSALPVLSAALS